MLEYLTSFKRDCDVYELTGATRSWQLLLEYLTSFKRDCDKNKLKISVYFRQALEYLTSFKRDCDFSVHFNLNKLCHKVGILDLI